MNGQGEGGRHQRSGSDEFEPLHSRQDVLSPTNGYGALGKARHYLRCCCTVEALFFLLGLTMLTYLSSINIGVRLPRPPTPGLNIKALEPSLDAFKTEFFTLYTTALSAQLLLMEFPASTLMGTTRVIFGASFARGSYGDDSSTMTLLHYPAENTDGTVFTFRLAEDMTGVDVLREELSLRTSDEGMAESLAGSAPAQWVTTLPVLDVRKGDSEEDLKILTSAEALLMNGFYVMDVKEALVAGMRVKLSETRAYPRNAGVTVEYQIRTLDAAGLPAAVVPISIRFSISPLPAEPMQPRRSDERVGFFNTVYKDLGDHRAVDANRRSSDLMDTKVTLINKRRMGGNDDPLIYYVDPSVPVEWREYMKAGVESWREAFKGAGLGDKAIKAVLPGDDDWPVDYDAGDIRFNSITWAVDMNEVFALGPATIDPRSGEILHSAIVFTNGWVKYWSQVFEVYGTSATTAPRDRSLKESPMAHHAHAHSHGSSDHDHHHGHAHRSQHSRGGAGAMHPQQQHHGDVYGNSEAEERREGVAAAALPRDHPLLVGGRGALRHGASGSLRYHGRDQCQEARMHDVSMSLLPLAAAHHERSRSLADGDTRGSAPGLATNDILGAGLKDVVMHEVGHTLGLRHNFQGSTTLSLSDLQDASKTSEAGLTSSVMDYLPINMVSSKLRGTDEPLYFTDKVGSYDMWAIKYGYMRVEGEQLLEEHEDLLKVASVAMPFSTDEDGAQSDGINPLASVYDLGQDPLDYHEDRLELMTELQPVLLDRSTLFGEPFSRFGAATKSVIRQVMSTGLFSTKFIGGFDVSKQRRLDDSTRGPMQLVSSDQQRRALKLILKVVVGEEPGGSASFLPSVDDFSNMAAAGGWCEGLEQDCYAVEPVDVLGEVSSMRKQILLQLFTADRVRRMRLHAWVDGADGDALTAAEMFQSTTDAIWGEGGFTSARAKLWDNWDLMLFWLDILQAYGSATVTSGVPGDATATAAGMVYSILDSGANVTTSHPAYGLYRAAARRVTEWEEHGTDGVLLSLLAGVTP